jgi:DNA-binding transcriptional regulator YhcF (GntR family)
LQNLLSVSDTTVGRYLDELEAAGTITQVGKTGKFVYYAKK